VFQGFATIASKLTKPDGLLFKTIRHVLKQSSSHVSENDHLKSCE